MANPNAPFGLIARRKSSGGYCNMQLRSYYVDPADATPLAIGDPVVRTGAADVNGIPTVTRATAGASNAITGVVEGFGETSLPLGYRPASTAGYVLVNDDPDAEFEIVETGNGGVTMAGNTANLTAGTANLATRQSTFQLNTASAGTGGTGQLKVIRAEHRVDNDPTLPNASWMVKINPAFHTELQSTGI